MITGTWQRGLAPAVILIALGSASDVAAQAWVRDPGGHYAKLAASYFYSDEWYNHEGDKEPLFAGDPQRSDQSFRDITFEAYVEYGLAPRTTFVARVPFKILTSSDVLASPSPRQRELTNGGLGDLWTSLRYGLAQGPTAVSVEGGVKVPLGYESVPDNQGPALGSGEPDLEVALYAGQSLWPAPVYVSAGIGYRYRSHEDLNDEIPFSVEGGVTLGRFFGKLRFEGIKSTEKPEDVFGSMAVTDSTDTGGRNPTVANQDIYKLLPVVSVDVGHGLSVFAELYHVLGGRNATAGTTYAIGVTHRR